MWLVSVPPQPPSLHQQLQPGYICCSRTGVTVLHVQFNYKRGRLFQAWHLRSEACHHSWSSCVWVRAHGLIADRMCSRLGRGPANWNRGDLLGKSERTCVTSRSTAELIYLLTCFYVSSHDHCSYQYCMLNFSALSRHEMAGDCSGS